MAISDNFKSVVWRGDVNRLDALFGGDWIALVEQHMGFEPTQLLVIGRRQNGKARKSGDNKLPVLLAFLAISILKTRTDWNQVGNLSAHVHTRHILRHAIHMPWRLSSRLFLFSSPIN